MKKNIREQIIRKIVESVPFGVKPSDYIAEVLDISKESAYRRLSGKMSFYVEELVILSGSLGFSVDELIARTNDESKVLISVETHEDPSIFFLERIKRFGLFLDKRLSDNSSEMIIALNYLQVEFCLNYESLFRLMYYLWIHWKVKNSNGLKYSEVKISPELLDLCKNLNCGVQELTNTTYIIDPNVFLTPLNLVLYYNKLGLINNEEKKEIKEDFHNMMDTIEKRLRAVDSLMETKNYYYRSNFNIDVNSAYYIRNGEASSSFLLYFFNQVVVNSPKICKAHKEWLQSLMKYSILISGSNEIDQAEYLKKQREYIDRL